MLQGRLLDELTEIVEAAERNSRSMTWGARAKTQGAPVSATYVYEFEPMEQLAGAA